jgi:hypothetical protein
MGGIVITPGQAIQLAELAAITIVKVAASANLAINQGQDTTEAYALAAGTPYRPTSWATKAQKYSIVIPPSTTSNTPVGTDVTGTIKVTTTASTMYVFDAVIQADHESQLDITEYPVQSGYNAAYNAVLKQKRVILEVKMSDAIDAYQAGMWIGNSSKSVSAFQTMLNLQQQRVFFTLNTRLYTYANCMLENVRSKDDAKTVNGAAMVLTIKQLFLSTVAQQTMTARPSATGNTQLGIIQGTPVPTPISTNNELLNNPSDTGQVLTGASSLDANQSVSSNDIQTLQDQFGTTPSPGLWSSNPVSSISSTLGGG